MKDKILMSEESLGYPPRLHVPEQEPVVRTGR